MVFSRTAAAMDAPAAAMITLVPVDGAGEAITMPREDAFKSDTLAGMLEGASHASRRVHCSCNAAAQ